jgi:hypothetical protein
MKFPIATPLLWIVFNLNLANGITPEQVAGLRVRSPQPTAATLESMAAIENRIVAVGTRGGGVKSMNGGSSWSTLPELIRSQVRQDMYGVATDGERFVAVGTYAAVTADLETWEWSEDSLASLRLDVAYGQRLFVAVGRTATVAVSSNGLIWTMADLPEGASLEAAAFGNGVFVGVRSNARIVRSADATNWITVKADEAGVSRFRGVSYAKGLFIAAGDGGLLYTSPDGLSWTKSEHGSMTNRVNTGMKPVRKKGRTKSGTRMRMDACIWTWNNGREFAAKC